MTEMLRKVVFPRMILKRKMAADRAKMTCDDSDSNSENESPNCVPSTSSSSSSSSPFSSSSPTSSSRKVDFSRCPLPLLLFLDGDYPQITALVNGLLAEFEDELISILKCPVGTSGISQPNDLMKAHLIFRQACGLGEYWSNFFLKKYKLPKYWIKQVLPYFKASGVSAASIDTYGYFFSTLNKLIAKAFRVEIVRKGMREI
jgi:hypothetical protein